MIDVNIITQNESESESETPSTHDNFLTLTKVIFTYTIAFIVCAHNDVNIMVVNKYNRIDL